MIITTTQQKPQIHLSNMGDVTLHRLIEVKHDIDALTATTSTLYQYEKVVFNLPYTNTLAQELQSNFDYWFKYGQNIEKANNELQTRLVQSRILLKEGEQPKINESFEQKADTSFGALVEIHMLILDLQAQIELLKGQTT